MQAHQESRCRVYLALDTRTCDEACLHLNKAVGVGECSLASQALQSSTSTDQIGAQGNGRHLLLECLAMQSVLEKFVLSFSEADALKISKWQENMFTVARYICTDTCACMKT